MNKNTQAVTNAGTAPRDQVKVVEYTLPVYWASYLINGDASGLEDGEQDQIDAFLKKERLPSPVSCDEDSHFSSYNDAMTGLGGEVVKFQFLLSI